MAILLVIILGLALLVWGVSSGMDSYASVKQAQAAIEASKAAQAASAVSGALIVLIAILVFVIVLLIAFILIAPKIRRALRRRQYRPGFGGYQIGRRGVDPQTALAVMEVLRAMQGGQQRSLPFSQDNQEYYYPARRERMTIDDDRW